MELFDTNFHKQLAMKLTKSICAFFFFVTCQVILAETGTFDAINDPVVQKRLINIKAKFEQLPTEVAESYKEHKKKAIKANEKQKYFTALIEANDALAIFRDDIDLLWLKGVCHAQLDSKEDAVAAYKEALDIHPNHAPSLLNIVEIYFYHGDYKSAIEYITYIRKYLSSAGTESSPLFDFKYLIMLTVLSKDDPATYNADLEKMTNKYTYLDDNPYYYYVKALKELNAGNNNDGQVWIYKAATIFQNPKMVKVWNKALEDSNFLAKHDIFIDTKLKQKRK